MSGASKPWLVTAQIAGPRVTLGDFDHQFQAWAARAHLLAAHPEAARPMVELNPDLFGAPLIRRAPPPPPTRPTNHWHEAVRRENEFYHHP